MEETRAEPEERNEEEDLEGIDQVVGELGCGDVEAEEKGEKQAQDGGGAEDGIDADHDADGQAPGETFGAGAEAKETEDGEGDSPVEPSVVGWVWRRRMLGGHSLTG